MAARVRGRRLAFTFLCLRCVVIVIQLVFFGVSPGRLGVYSLFSLFLVSQASGVRAILCFRSGLVLRVPLRTNLAELFV